MICSNVDREYRPFLETNQVQHKRNCGKPWRETAAITAAIHLYPNRYAAYHGILHLLPTDVLLAVTIFTINHISHETWFSLSKLTHGNRLVYKLWWRLIRYLQNTADYSSRDDARSDVVDYMEMFYNSKRRLGFNHQLSPVEYEKRFTERLVSV